jgi:S-ribosylhomocysteine lyase LuxS involved in autoinducer biosynthesis
MDERLSMSTKKESEKTTTNVSDDTARVEITASLLEQHHSVDRALDETRDNIRRTIEEARREIPRHTQAFNDYQEHSLQTAREVTDRYLENQKEITPVNMGSIHRKHISRILEQVGISTKSS